LRLDQYLEAEAARFNPGACRAAGLEPAALRQVQSAARALMAGAPGAPEAAEPSDREERLLQALLRGYPDRVAKVGGNGTCTLVGGGGARLDPACRVRRSEWILALEAELQGTGPGNQVAVRMASRVEPHWLLDAFPESLSETEDLSCNPSTGRVSLHACIWFEDLCLDETRRPAPPGHPGSAECLAEAALARGLGEAQATVDGLLARAAFLARTRPELELPPGPQLLEALVREACQGRTALKELEGSDWPGSLRRALGPEGGRLLDTWAPEWVLLGKRKVKVDYGGEAPSIASRLQDFLGLKQGPRLAGGSVPVVLHLLAPNMRAVQVTTDLAGFWLRAYKDLRPALSRRYPRHQWPEDPC